MRVEPMFDCMSQPSPNPRILSLRYDGTCAVCARELPRRTRAWWYAASKKIVCFECRPQTATYEVEDETAEEEAAEVVDTPDTSPKPAEEKHAASEPDVSELLHDGEAGASARREGARRAARREREIVGRHPHLGKLILAVSEEPQTIRAWSKGAAGEEALGARLNELATERLVVLHDRRVPHSRANIDHIAVTPGGVFVIDAKHYGGRVEKRDLGGWSRSDVRLYVGKRDCTKLVLASEDQGETVRDALASLGVEGVPVRPVLCFIGAEWGLFASPFKLGSVLVTWPKSLYALLQTEEEIETAIIQKTGRHLARTLPRA
jgi:Nuclease-related domain